MFLYGPIEEAISAVCGKKFTIKNEQPCSGGCINDARIVTGHDGQRYFVKMNSSAGAADMFAAEIEGLRDLRTAEAIRAPQPICQGDAEGTAFLVLEHLEMGADNATTQTTLGMQLAKLHRYQQPDGKFGWHRDNTIGETPQLNGWMDSWVDFYRERRLRFQVDLARRQGAGRFTKAETLMDKLPAFFESYSPAPSLLHGDLWGGNISADAHGQPVFFDPAVYFGDREADLAFTEMFGGFSSDFYRAYDQAWPRDSGYATRKVLYNLYHLLNHANIFGGGYARQAERSIDWLLAQAS